jgi:hypothetical protein
MRNRTKAKKRTSELLPVILIGLGVILVIGALVWQAVRTGEVTGQNIPEASVQRVTLAEAKAAFDSKTAVFLDVRDSASYQTSHIPGAVNIPVGEIETRLKELDPNQWIITYCT